MAPTVGTWLRLHLRYWSCDLVTAIPTLETVRLEVRDSVGYLSLNRPEALNAINFQLIEDVEAALTYLESDRSAKDERFRWARTSMLLRQG